MPRKNNRSRDIEINPQESTEHPQEKPYELHIQAANFPGMHEAKPETPIEKPKPEKRLHPQSRIAIKAWNFLEWLAMSALIFVILFFIVNYQSYSELLKTKIAQLTGGFKVNPYIQQLTETKTPGQELLPTAKNTIEKKEELPPLDIQVAPPDERIIIPRINKNVPVVGVSSENLIKRDWNALEKEIQNALQDGVVHYPGTAEPGENGNVVITGHSSYFAWDPGRFKDVFALLHDVNIGDEVIVFWDQKKYSYTVYDKIIVTPDKINVLTQEGENRLTLITCTPVGTNLKRLVVFARPQ